MIVCRNLGPALKYEEAKEHHFPFYRLADENPDTAACSPRATSRNGQPAFVIANNKAEGNAPLALLKLAEAIDDANVAG